MTQHQTPEELAEEIKMLASRHGVMAMEFEAAPPFSEMPAAFDRSLDRLDRSRSDLDAAIDRLAALASANAERMHELRRALAAIGVVGQIDGHDVVRRLSVLDIADRRLMVAWKEQS